MKIACIIHSLDGGGAERVMAALTSRLAAREHAVTLVTLGGEGDERHTPDDDVTRRRLDVMGESRGVIAKIRNTRARVHAIRNAIREESPDVVLSFCDRTNILALMAVRPLKLPIVVSERSDPSQQNLGLLWETLRDRSYRNASAIIALTEASAAYLRSRFAARVVVIPSAVDQPPIRSDRESANQNRRILGVGRLEHEKGFDRLIEAFASIAAGAPDWSLKILGEGSLRTELESQVRDLGLSERISLPGWVHPVWEELAAATLFALPSRYEGFPSALLEAMALGVPSVAVDCESGPRVVIDDPHVGLLVPNRITDLADGMRMLIQNAELREQLGHSATSIVDRFGWDAMVDAYEELIRKLAD